MVEIWCGGMNVPRLVLLVGLQAWMMISLNFAHAEDIQLGPSRISEFQILTNSKFKETSHRTLVFQDLDESEQDSSDLESTDLFDAQWTAKPNLDKSYENYNQNFKRKNKNSRRKTDKNTHFVSHKSKNNKTKIKSLATEKRRSNNGGKVMTTPSSVPETTPFYTEPITTEMDTTSYVTETITQPITTEMEYEDTADEAQMLRNLHRRWNQRPDRGKRRWKRGTDGGDDNDDDGGATVTTPDPATTSVAPNMTCEGESYYDPEDDDCSCPQEREGDGCDEEMNDDNVRQQEQSTLTYSGLAEGPYDNSHRALFENQLRLQFANRTGFRRVYVHPITYNATSNYSTITFDVIFDREVTPEETSQSSSVVSNVTANVVPINVNQQTVVWAEESVLTLTEEDGTVTRIPVSEERTRLICYVYNKIEACQNGGHCVNTTGSPDCVCTENYHGKYCEALIQRLADTEETIMAVLLPVIASASGLVLLCAFCFAAIRRVSRGEGEEASSVSSSVPASAIAVPKMFFHDTNWRQFDRGLLIEEEPVIEYHREVIEVDYERDCIWREPVNNYYFERPRSHSFTSIRSVSSDSSSRSSRGSRSSRESRSSRGSWRDDAPRLGRRFHIDRPEWDSDSNSAYF